MKYFFLSDGWIVGRVWELGGLWDASAWRRPPQIQQLDLGIVEKEEIFWLYQVEDPVLMLEVMPTFQAANPGLSFGQVVLRRLMSAEQVIERLGVAEKILHQPDKN